MDYVRTGLSNARQELTSPLFDLSEPSQSSDNLLSATAPPRIDVSKTFSPQPHYATIPIKLFLTVWVLALLGLSITGYTYQSFWLAYLTNWGWIFVNAYFVSSLVTAISLMKWKEGKALELLVKITWVRSLMLLFVGLS